mmetsp:Transcript_141/g.198  ORF Transcript_141/g.198 Transcript_141/m.198 type:complete len:514 (+) Transcript_141:81-1622(+)
MLRNLQHHHSTRNINDSLENSKITSACGEKFDAKVSEEKADFDNINGDLKKSGKVPCRFSNNESNVEGRHSKKCLRCLLVLLSLLIFLFPSPRVRQMDVYDFMDDGTSSSVDNFRPGNDTFSDRMDNGWIPNTQIEHFSNLHRMKKSTESNRTDDSNNIGGRYQPSLNRYPLTMLKNLVEPLEPNDIIFFWHIPKAAGTTVKHVLTKCYDLIRPIRPEQAAHPPSLEIIHNTLNVDTSTIAGIARAKHANLTSLDKVDFIVSSHLHEGSALFTPDHKGRMITFLRHPVHLAVSLFHYLGHATWERNYRKEFANMTLLDYATSEQKGVRIDNWMTRYLSRNIAGVLDETHLQLAMDILREKCLVGLVDEMEESFRRISLFFGIYQGNKLVLTNSKNMNGHKTHTKQNNNITMTSNKVHNSKSWHQIKMQLRKNERIVKRCVYNHTDGNIKANEHKHTEIIPGSKEWSVLAEKNSFDMQLYSFAKDELWPSQGKMIQDHDWNGRRWRYRYIDISV